MYAEVISKEDLRVLQACPKEVSNFFYLAGGTALALQIGHRYSHDFDFFSSKEFNNEWLKQRLSPIGILEIFQDKKGTLEGNLVSTRLSFFYYPYPLLQEPIPFKNIKLASIADITLMKLSALSSRGSKKDFIDLFFLRERIEWKQLIRDYEKKFYGTGYNLYHLIKSLAYFDDANIEPMPQMLKDCNWSEVQKYFVQVQQELIDEYLR